MCRIKENRQDTWEWWDGDGKNPRIPNGGKQNKNATFLTLTQQSFCWGQHGLEQCNFLSGGELVMDYTRSIGK
jgi:hypothetical protein